MGSESRPAPQAAAPESAVGDYRVLRALGSGGFGSVVQAEHIDTGEQVALKELNRGHPAALARFKQEFRALQDLHHPNLVGLKALFEHDGRWLIVMELIEGTDLLDWVRPGADNANSLGFHEQRLRQSLRGIAEGLHALHEAGLVHRDLKPANVRVTPEGRAVLLDFGLITTTEHNAQSTQATAMGTAAYMAPEQAAGQKVGPAADWYALGGTLYEALTGKPPFEGKHALAILMAKQGKLPVPPSQRTPEPGLLAADLEQVCMKLLSPEPTERAGVTEVRALHVAPDPDSRRARAPSHTATSLTTLCPTSGVQLAGRDNELHFLRTAFDRTQQGQLRMVLVEGESGIGKSALVGEFVRRLKSTHPDALVLNGRCYENERVPYKAFDGCVDALARALKRLDDHEVARLVPPRAAVLAELFPVLGDVPTIATASRKGLPADPTARRLEAFRALAGLLHELAVDRPLVLAIDDLQWADDESFRLLDALAEHAPPLLLVFTVRPLSELTTAVDTQVKSVRSRTCSHVLALAGLAPAGARELAAQLLGAAAPPDWVRHVADESQGHPLFISTLAQYAVSASQETGSQGLTLEAALAVRVSSLKPASRRLLELLALAGRPYNRQLFAQALNTDFSQALTPLLRQNLARVRGERQLVCFHDRIRKQVLDMAGRSGLAELHRDLALALESQVDGDPADRARHWEGAGESARACEAYAAAGKSALAAFAFQQAEESFARALALGGHLSSEQQRTLRVQRAYALARGGKSAGAVALFQEAAEGAEGAERVRLRIEVAKHLLQSAQVEQGLNATHALFDDLGMGLPRSTGAALARIAWDRTRIGLRGLKLKPAPEAGLDGRTQLQLEAAWQLSAAVAWVEVLPSANLSAAHLRRALDSGDPAHAARALANEATMRAVQKPMAVKQYAPLLETSRELAEQVGDPALQAFVTWGRGMTWMFRSEFTQALACFRDAEATLCEQCPDEPWLLTNVRATMGSTMTLLGEHRALVSQSEDWLTQALEREDRFAHTALMGMGAGSLRHLMADTPEAALAELRSSMAVWPREPFSSSSLGELLSVGHIESYRQGPGLLRWLEGERARLTRAWMLKVPFMQAQLTSTWTVAILSALVVAPESERPALQKQAWTQVRSLQRSELRVHQAYASLFHAQLLALEGKLDRALAESRNARERFAELGLYSQYVASYLEGVLEGDGEAGREKRDAAVAFFVDQGWQRPDRALTMLAPALPALEQGRANVRAAPAPIAFGERFQVLQAVGATSHGCVTKARDVRTGRTVALKELTQSSPAALLRFKQEFRALQGLRHPRLARLDALFEDSGTWFIAMEYVPGTNVLDWVRPKGQLDVQRAREAFAQLAEGLAVLHEAGFCHREVKPDNVRVTPQGRVVLVDFGFVVDLASPTPRDQHTQVGSAAYAAPEQTPGAEIAPQADLYAMGVCLYQALCGELPFEEAAAEPAHGPPHRAAPPPPPSNRAPTETVPGDLDALAMELMDVDPASRPPATSVPARLLGRSKESDRAPIQSWRPDGRGFSGRTVELAALDECFDRSLQGTPTVVFVEGESGMGKSALVEYWLAQTRGRCPSAVVLRGRCFDNEQVPYAAVDGVVDHLSQVLRQRSEEQCRAVLPPRAAVLQELFAVLGSVRCIGEAPRKGVLADPNARRLQGFAALRTLLVNLCGQAPLVIAVDDLHWADLESFRLLHALLQEGQVPPLLFVATVRPAAALSPDVEQALRSVCDWPCSTRLQVGPLPPSEARSMATRLLTDPEPGLLERVLVQAQGHPMFLYELANHASSASSSGDALTLDAAIEARIRTLGADARRLLQFVALVGRPQGVHVYASALEAANGTPASALDEALAELCAARLLRVRKNQLLTCFHERIRVVAASTVAEGDRPTFHRALAGAVDGERGADAAECARLWELSGDHERAAGAYTDAGQAALDALAFARAAELFAEAVKLSEDAEEQGRRRRTVLHAHALARGGKSQQAAALYKSAAEHAQGQERVRLCIWAAQHLLQSAQVQEGLEATRALLDELGMGLPQGTGASVARIAWDRTRLGLRGLALRQPPPNGLDAHTQLQLEAAWKLSAPVAWVEVLPSANLSAAHLRRALDSGDRAHAARALANEAAMRAVQKPMASRAYEPLLATSRELAERVADPALQGFVDWQHGITCIFRSMPTEAVTCLAQAEATLRERCPDDPWLLTNVRATLGSARAMVGAHRTLATQTADWLAQALEREDLFAQTAVVGMGFGFLRHLMADAPEEAVAELETGMAAWPREPFSSASLGELCAIQYIEGYRGGDGLLRKLEAERARHERAWLLKVPFMRSQLTWAWARASLSATVVAPAAHRGALLKRAHGCVRTLRRSDLPVDAPLAALFHAQLLALEGDTEPALQQARSAAEGFRAIGMVEQYATDYLTGLLEGGEGGQQKRAAATRFFREQGWVRPDRALSAWLPALPALL